MYLPAAWEINHLRKPIGGCSAVIRADVRRFSSSSPTRSRRLPFGSDPQGRRQPAPGLMQDRFCDLPNRADLAVYSRINSMPSGGCVAAAPPRGGPWRLQPGWTARLRSRPRFAQLAFRIPNSAIRNQEPPPRGPIDIGTLGATRASCGQTPPSQDAATPDRLWAGIAGPAHLVGTAVLTDVHVPIVRSVYTYI